MPHVMTRMQGYEPKSLRMTQHPEVRMPQRNRASRRRGLGERRLERCRTFANLHRAIGRRDIRRRGIGLYFARRADAAWQPLRQNAQWKKDGSENGRPRGRHSRSQSWSAIQRVEQNVIGYPNVERLFSETPLSGKTRHRPLRWRYALDPRGKLTRRSAMVGDGAVETAHRAAKLSATAFAFGNVTTAPFTVKRMKGLW